MTTVAPARRGSSRRAVAVTAHVGLAARAVVYVVLAWLALEIALGHGSSQANQRGAVETIGQRSYGIVLLWALGLGLAAYCLWRLSQAAGVAPAPDDGAAAKVRALFTGVVYGALSLSTFELIAGRAQQGQSQQQAAWTARLMGHTGGRWLVGLIGVVVVAVAVAMIVEGVRRDFEKRLRLGEMSRRTRRTVVALGTAGTIARGVVVAVTGALVLDAAVTFDPAKSTGLDGALRTLADRTYGAALLGVVAVGLLAYGAYAVAEARWAIT
jgi:Domain of Unknown Function (DUF1206)